MLCYFLRQVFHVVPNGSALPPGAVWVPSKSTDQSFRLNKQSVDSPWPWHSLRYCFAARGKRPINNEKGHPTTIEREVLLFGWTIEEATDYGRKNHLEIVVLTEGEYA